MANMRLSKRHVIAAVFTGTLALIFLFYALCVFLEPQTIKMEMRLSVGKEVGFDINTTAVTFGSVPPSGTSTRDVVISNTDGYDKAVSFGVEGAISGFVKPPKETAIRANSNATVSVRAEVPPGAESGNYTGTLKIFLRRAI